jgi:hypothetical protein
MIDLAMGSASLSLNDWNADGRLDLAVTTNDQYSYVQLSLGNGNGTFQATQYIPMNGSPLAVAAADVNQDGKLDLVAVNGSGGTGISVSLGNGDGTFQDQQTFDYASLYAALAVGDFNGDGYPDLVAIDDSSVSIFLNDTNW